MSTPVVIALASALPLFLAVAMLLIGLRGRRVDDHPLCRRCGFDLVGLPPASRVCSECGAALDDERAIRTGHRVRRTGMIALSLALLVPSLLWIGVLAYVATGKVDWIAYKPTWWLVRDAQTDPASMAELLNRLAKGKLSRSDIDAAVARALATQADRATPWNGGWGDFVEQARSVGTVSDVDWTRYAMQAVVLNMRARPMVARGDPIWVEVSLVETRAGTRWMSEIRGVESSRRIDGVECGNAAIGGFFFDKRLNALGGSGSLLRPDPDIVAKLSPGTKTLEVTYDVEPSSNGLPMPVTQQQVQCKFELDNPPAKTVEVVEDKEAWEQVCLLTTVRSATYYPSGDMSLVVTVAPPRTLDLVYKVYARLPDGSELKLGPLAARRGLEQSFRLTGSVGRLGPEVKQFDLVLRPSVEVALQSLHLTRLCGGEVCVRDIPITRTAERAPLNEQHERLIEWMEQRRRPPLEPAFPGSSKPRP